MHENMNYLIVPPEKDLSKKRRADLKHLSLEELIKRARETKIYTCQEEIDKDGTVVVDGEIFENASISSPNSSYWISGGWESRGAFVDSTSRNGNWKRLQILKNRIEIQRLNKRTTSKNKIIGQESFRKNEECIINHYENVLNFLVCNNDSIGFISDVYSSPTSSIEFMYTPKDQRLYYYGTNYIKKIQDDGAGALESIWCQLIQKQHVSDDGTKMETKMAELIEEDPKQIARLDDIQELCTAYYEQLSNDKKIMESNEFRNPFRMEILSREDFDALINKIEKYKQEGMTTEEIARIINLDIIDANFHEI